MDFGLIKQQLKLKESVRTFCEKEFDPDYALEMDRKETFPIELYKKAAKQGFSSLFIPEKYGMQVVIGTHPIPEKYYKTHKNLGTWSENKWDKIVAPTITDEKIRLAYD